MISMVMGPLLAARYGLPILFWITAGLALAGIAVVVFITPQPRSQTFHRDTQLSMGDVRQISKNPELLRLDLGIFVLHLVLSATFVVFPLVLRDHLLVDVALHWKTYLPVFALSVLGMVPMIIVEHVPVRYRHRFNRGTGTRRSEHLRMGIRDAGTIFHRIQLSRSLATISGRAHRTGRYEGYGNGIIFQFAVPGGFLRRRDWRSIAHKPILFAGFPGACEPGFGMVDGSRVYENASAGGVKSRVSERYERRGGRFILKTGFDDQGSEGSFGLYGRSSCLPEGGKNVR